MGLNRINYTGYSALTVNLRRHTSYAVEKAALNMGARYEKEELYVSSRI
jgi:hypothetical protein